MYVKQLTLTNFRNYSELNVNFNSDKIFITGDNGIGKTNIIESIYYLTLGRTFRKADDVDLIKRGEKEGTIFLQYHSDSDNKDHTLSCAIGNGYKIFCYDGDKVKTLSKILGKLLCVNYDPSLVFLFRGEPADRRRLLDETISMISSEYFLAISRYKKLIKERNAAMAKEYDQEIIDVLRNELIRLSYKIVKERKQVIKELSKKVSEYYLKLFSGEKKLTLRYKTNCPIVETEKEFTDQALDLFDKNKTVEALRGQTLIGPHRDDLTALLDKDDVSAYGSQGENRLASLSLKLAIRDLLTEKLNEVPILLLDDVTSDLDQVRSLNLLKAVKEKGQVIVTGTKIPDGYDEYTVLQTDGKTVIRRES